MKTLPSLFMDTALFDYELPPERIAQEPATERDRSRLLVVHRDTRTVEHRQFRELPEYVRPTDLFFRNAARVLPARIYAHRPTGGRVECLLLRPAAAPIVGRQSVEEDWWCLLKPGRKLPIGSSFSLEEAFEATVVDKNESAEYRVRFVLSKGGSVAKMAAEHGKMPLPPYIERSIRDQRDPNDRERYQTVYAQNEKSVAAAAPTAGLHFTGDLIHSLEKTGAKFHNLILHVGMGTFKPLEAGRLEDHQMHSELYEVPEATQNALRNASENGQRRIAIGTTSLRSIEDYLGKTTSLHPGSYVDEASLFLYPPAQFNGVDALITNFHLPKSTLLCLVSAFLTPGSTEGIDWLKTIYAEAIERQYRFLSYGDAMLIL